jgi:hypothetical protein
VDGAVGGDERPLQRLLRVGHPAAAGTCDERVARRGRVPGASREAQQAEKAGPSLEGHGVVLTSLRSGRTRLVNESPHTVDATFAGRKLRFEPWQIQTTTHD